MKNQKTTSYSLPSYLPTMTGDYSRISDTAREVDLRMAPRIISYLQDMASHIARMDGSKPFVIADYGAADGVNSSELFVKIIEVLRKINPSLKIELFYIDIAERTLFDEFWDNSRPACLDGLSGKYIQRSFYESLPELSHRVNLGFSSTAMHWLDTGDLHGEFFQHPVHIQANQLQRAERRKFANKWRRDWQVFFSERSAELVPDAALFLANLTDLGGDQWPASAGYDYIRDICCELHNEGRISSAELKAVFVPDYFATPAEMKSFLTEEHERHRRFCLKSCEEMTVPCAYFSKFGNCPDNPQVRTELADTLAKVVRAWSRSSVGTGLAQENKEVIDDIYGRLRDKFYENPKALPYQYCLLELIRTAH